MNQSLFNWTPTGRFLVFVLAATSIWSLLSDFFHIMSMRSFALGIQLPATIALIAIAFYNRNKGDGQLASAIWMGGLAGFLAAIAYDIFRLPFVYSKEWGLSAFVPALKLFKVFPRFGAMLLGQPVEQPTYSTTANVAGWIYHFSNGITFGIMYLALIGSGLRRSWWWAVVFAVGLEIALLLTPYATFFGIKVTPTFIAVTLTAHIIFGIAMGLLIRRYAAARAATSGMATGSA